MDMRLIEFDSLVLSAKAVGKNVLRFAERESSSAYATVIRRSIELLIEDMEKFRDDYLKEQNDG